MDRIIIEMLFEDLVKFVTSLYFIIRWGRIKFECTDHMEAWGSYIESEAIAKARGVCIGCWAHGAWEEYPEAIYYGQDLHNWCYVGGRKLYG